MHGDMEVNRRHGAIGHPVALNAADGRINRL